MIERIYSGLRQEIINRRIPPGTKLSETHLSRKQRDKSSISYLHMELVRKSVVDKDPEPSQFPIESFHHHRPAPSPPNGKVREGTPKNR